MENKEAKRFEDWEKVDCNDCSHYWDSSCDGVSKGSMVGCNSYLATRKVVIPERLNSLEKQFRKHLITDILYGVVLLFHLLSHLFGWF